MDFKPTNELERLLEAGEPPNSEKFIKLLLKSKVFVWISPPKPGDGPGDLSVVLAPAKDGTGSATFAFTSEKAFKHWLASEGRPPEHYAELPAEALFDSLGTAYDIVFNLGHKVCPHFPKGSLVRETLAS